MTDTDTDTPPCGVGATATNDRKRGQMVNTLQRTSFSTSRLLEFFNQKELEMQIGHERDTWPIALTKELIDNGLDACESAGVEPVIRVELEQDAVSISDNGPGLPDDVLRRSLDYSIRVSDKNHYIAPTRGQLGNALKTVWAAPFAVDGEHGQVDVWTRGNQYTIDVSLDRIAQTPILELSETPGHVKNGTTIKMHWPEIASYLEQKQNTNFYNEPIPALLELLQNYSLFNPHVSFAMGDWLWSASDPTWQKWTPITPTSPHWYTVENVRNLAAAYLSAGQNKTIREFVAEFRGLSGTGKQKAVTDGANLTGQSLGDLVKDGDFEIERLGLLLEHMQTNSRAINPKLLGVIGDAHIRRWMIEQGAAADSVEYRYKTGEVDGLPYVLEMAFGVMEDGGAYRRVVSGLNWTPALRVPFSALDNMMNECLVQRDDPVLVAVHLVCPKLGFTDRGKSRLQLPSAIRGDFETAFALMTKDWTKAKKQSAKQEGVNERQLDEMRRKRKAEKMTIKDACYLVMAEAYTKASSNGRFPANARQVMYAARPLVLALCGEFYKNSPTFTQTILPDFQTENPTLTADWDVVYDARGHLIEPHGGESIDLGTLSVRRYVTGWTNGVLPTITSPYLSSKIRTSGPHNRYSAVLFIEKEGFNELLLASGIADRYDIAIQSTKGQTVTAARQLAEHYAEKGVRIFVLHDFDKSGIEIVASYRNDTRRYQYDTRPLITDIGLRLEDVLELGLEVDGAEDVSYTSGVHPGENLRACGATEAEIRFLVQKGHRKAWQGKRVELNALTSEQFIRFIEHKLEAHGVTKVMPDNEDFLAAAYKRAVTFSRLQQHVDRLFADAQKELEQIPVPVDLREQLERRLEHSHRGWDVVLGDLVDR
jgi:DNA topoisomerase VI subunit B